MTQSLACSRCSIHVHLHRHCHRHHFKIGRCYHSPHIKMEGQRLREEKGLARVTLQYSSRTWAQLSRPLPHATTFTPWPLLPEDITPQQPSQGSLPVPHDLMQEATFSPNLGASTSMDKAPASEQGKPSSFPLYPVSQNLSPKLHPILLPSWGSSASLWIPTIPQVSSSLDLLISSDPGTTQTLLPWCPRPGTYLPVFSPGHPPYSGTYTSNPMPSTLDTPISTSRSITGSVSSLQVRGARLRFLKEGHPDMTCTLEIPPAAGDISDPKLSVVWEVIAGIQGKVDGW